MQVYPPYFMPGVPQGQRAYFPTVASFRPWQAPMHGRNYGFMPNQRRAMGGGPRPQIPRASGQQRLGGGARGGMDRMQQQQQAALTGQQVGGLIWCALNERVGHDWGLIHPITDEV